MQHLLTAFYKFHVYTVMVSHESQPQMRMSGKERVRKLHYVVYEVFMHEQNI